MLKIHHGLNCALVFLLLCPFLLQGQLSVSITANSNFISPCGSTIIKSEVSGNSGFVTYQWNTPLAFQGIDFQPDIVADVPGTYLLVVSDNQTFAISEDEQIVELLFTVEVNPAGGSFCEGGNKLVLEASTMPAATSYQWMTPPGFSNPTNQSLLTADVEGQYQVTAIIDGCEITSKQVNVSETELEIGLSKSDPTSAGASDGSISVLLAGGSPPFQWSASRVGSPSIEVGTSNSANFEITNLEAGAYQVNVKDNNNCPVTSSIILSDPACDLTADAFVIETPCENENNGRIRVNVSGGKGPYTIIWDGPVSGETQISGSTYFINNLPSGTYQVVVKDEIGCDVTVNVNLSEHPSPSFSIVGDRTFCAEEGGTSLSVTPSNFASYQWSNGSSTPTTNITSSQNISVTVTDFNGCTGNSSASVVELDPIEINTISSGSNFTVSCNGTCDGSIAVSISGGSEKGITYSWSGPNGYTNSAASIAELCPGVYQVFVSDSEGCTANRNFEITEPSTITLALSANAPSCSNSNDGTITATFNGGVPPYSISWNGPENGNLALVNSPETIQGLPSGNYTVSVNDSNGCSRNSTINVASTQPLNFNANELSPSCQGANSGSISITNITSNNPPFLISWSEVGGSASSAMTNGSNYTIQDLAAGSYNITVQDANDCVNSLSGVVVTEEAQITVNIVGDLVLCPDSNSGLLSTSPNGYSSYLWSTGSSSSSINISSTGLYAVTVTDQGGCTGNTSVTISESDIIVLSTNMDESQLIISCNGDCDGKITPKISGGKSPYQYMWAGPNGFLATTANIDNLCPGDYSLTLIDANGCSSEYEETVQGNSDLDLSVEGKPASCPGLEDGEATAKAENGSPPYSYQWSNGALGSFINGLSAGTYTVTATDVNGCFETAEVIIGELSGVTGSISPLSPVICINEMVTLTASGGSTYLWSTGQTTRSIVVQPASTTTYNVTVTNSGTSCFDIASVTVKVNKVENARISVIENSGNQNNDAILCRNDMITLQALGGTSYIWEGGFSNPLVITPQETSTFSVNITDSNGCSQMVTQEVIVNELPQANIDFSSLNFIVGEEQQFINISEANCGDLESCSWSFDEVIVNNSCGSVVTVFDETGTHSVLLEVENSCGCESQFAADFEIFSPNECQLLFGLNTNNESICIGEAIALDLEFVPRTGCEFSNAVVRVYDGNEEIDSYEIIDDRIIFSEAGRFSIEAIYTDDCGCSSFVRRIVDIVDSPEIQFADKEPITVCTGNFFTVELADFDNGEKANVEFNGVNYIIESASFELFAAQAGTYTLALKSVELGSCSRLVEDEVIQIEVIENINVTDARFACDDLNGTYTLTLTIEGGDPNATIISSFAGIKVGDNSYVISNLDPLQEYEILLQRGDFCGSFAYIQPQVTCNCSTDVGTMKDDVYFTDCTGVFFDISNIYSGVDNANSFFDTLLYFLHDGEIPGQLGRVFAIYPITQQLITNDFVDYTPNKLYQLSAVRSRKFAFKNLIKNGVSQFNFLGINECLAVSNSIPIIWNGSNVNITGPSSVCENAYNEIYVSSGIGDGAEIDIAIEGLDQNNYSFVPSDGRLYVHFVNGVQENVPISITSITSHTNYLLGDTINTTCVSDITYQVNIDQTHEAPDTSSVILWPGAIFASTDTTENICHRWGKSTRISSTEVVDTIFEGENDRFYFGDVDEALALNENRQIWVETYYCDDPVCFTRNIFNGAFPINLDLAINQNDIRLFPNPVMDDLNLVLNNEYIGNIKFRVLDIHGRQLYYESFKKSGRIVNKNINLAGYSAGIYVLTAEFEKNTRLTYKVIKH